MPIEIDPTDSSTAVIQPLVCDALFIDRLSIDGTSRDAAPPKVSAVITPYKLGVTNVYAAESWELSTGNVYAAAAHIPQIGMAIQAVFDAMGAWHTYNLARQADLDAAKTAFATAVAGEASVQAALDQVLVIRNQAFVSRAGDEADPTWLAADAAWQAAVTAVAAAQAAIGIAHVNVDIAKAALADPANPKLVIATP